MIEHIARPETGNLELWVSRWLVIIRSNLNDVTVLHYLPPVVTYDSLSEGCHRVF